MKLMVLFCFETRNMIGLLQISMC